MMTGNTKSKDVEKKMKDSRTDSMTAYLENASIKPIEHKNAKLTPQEREAALKAIKHYRSLSLEEIETLLETGEEKAVPKKKRRHLRKNVVKALILALISISIIVVLCWLYEELRPILIPLVISFEAAFASQHLLFKGAYKK